MNCEYARIWKKAAVANLNVLLKHSHGDRKENLQAGLMLTRQRFVIYVIIIIITGKVVPVLN
jgi:hypothetical protein